MTRRIKVLTFHQMDPLGSKIGGAETFIKNLIKYAPEDFDIEFVGVSSDKGIRNIGRWVELELYGKRLKFLPTIFVQDENVRTKIPLSLKFTLSLFRYRSRVPLKDRILLYHRLEPSLPFRNTNAKKVLFMHGHMLDFYNPSSEARWSKIPRLYFQLEKHLLKQFERIFIVREDGVRYYKNKYSLLQDRFFFLPTGVDEDIFFPYDDLRRKEIKYEFSNKYGFSDKETLILFAGRLEGQKDPLLLVDTFHYMSSHISNIRLLIVGTGSLGYQMGIKIKKHGLEDKITLLGALSQNELAALMRISDVFLLTSAFEGMPIAVLEALACGLPVVSPDVGEVRRVVKNGVSGIICTERTPETLGNAVLTVLESSKFTSENCAQAIQDYTAKRILGNIYRFYYQLSRIK
jgi:glycosyltransferase involved in cell wall biosynthesis